MKPPPMSSASAAWWLSVSLFAGWLSEAPVGCWLSVLPFEGWLSAAPAGWSLFAYRSAFVGRFKDPRQWFEFAGDAPGKEETIDFKYTWMELFNKMLNFGNI